MSDSSLLEQVILQLESLGGVKFGEFTLKNGIISPVYFDLRVIVQDAKLMSNVATLLEKAFVKAKPAVLCGVPYTALPLATLMAVNMDLPMLIRRKEAKAYGTKKVIEGLTQDIIGKDCLIIEVRI